MDPLTLLSLLRRFWWLGLVAAIVAGYWVEEGRLAVVRHDLAAANAKIGQLQALTADQKADIDLQSAAIEAEKQQAEQRAADVRKALLAAQAQVQARQHEIDLLRAIPVATPGHACEDAAKLISNYRARMTP